MTMRYGTFRDLMSCLEIYNGAENKEKSHITNYDEAMSLR